MAGGNREVIAGDCLSLLQTFPDASFDAVVTDPPASISFMGKHWDSAKGGREAWIGWLARVAEELLRVVKPGAHALVWALPRRSHWTGMALELAGWEMRDRISHLFGQGNPKSHRLDNAIDRTLGCPPRGRAIPTASTHLPSGRYAAEKLESNRVEPYTARTPEGARWSGWGLALKPAVEDWWLCRRSFRGTVAANVREHGTGGLNVDGCRVGVVAGKQSTLGRRPAHLVLSHDPRCVLLGTEQVKGSRVEKPCPAPEIAGHRWGTLQSNRGPRGVGDANNEETVEVWACVPGCPVRMLDDQSGPRGQCGPQLDGSEPSAARTGVVTGLRKRVAQKKKYERVAGASKFFYTAKAPRSEREAGLLGVVPCAKCGGLDSVQHRYADDRLEDCLRNDHPTVKSVALMRWLVRLVTPPGGRVLDPFAGSGTTGIACVEEGFSFVGIEQEARSVEIARARIQHAEAGRKGEE